MAADDYFGSGSFQHDLVDVMSEDILRDGAPSRRPSLDELELAQFREEVLHVRGRRRDGHLRYEDEYDDDGE